jgi:hypothetical protein
MDCPCLVTRFRPARFESLVTTISDGAQVTDLAISRANYLMIAQLIWQSGCEGNLSKLKNFRCRAAILQALLQYRLSGNIAFDADSPEYRLDLVANLRDNWAVHWPGGLLLASAQIPDRDPFNLNLSDISHNPLSLRPAHAFWQKPDEALSKGIIYRIAGFLTRADIQRLDRHLLKLASSNGIESERYQAVCHININSIIRFPNANNYNCSNRSSSQSINATIEIEYHDNQITFLGVVSLSLLDSSLIWQPAVSTIKILDIGSHRQLNAKLSGPSDKLSARLQNGNRISEMILNWPLDSTNSGPPKSLDMELIVSQDFKVLQKAIDQMISAAIAGKSQALVSRPFRQRTIINDLENYLGMKALKW